MKLTNHLARLPVFLIFFVLAACGGGGGGSSAPDNTGGSPSSGGLPTPAQSTDLNVVINNVTVSGSPAVDFTVTNQDGTGVTVSTDDVNAGSLRFTIVKLVPGSNGDADNWRSYISTTETATPTAGPNGVAVLASAQQATAEARTSAGVLESLGNGKYRYTFRTDITDPAQTGGVAYDASLTHRVAMQVSFTGSGGKSIVKNPTFDFVPAGGVLRQTKDVVSVDSCNTCHDKLALHGGGRVDTKYCVTCHNPGTTDANSGNNLNFAVMIHKIHRGADLSSTYTIWGFRDSAHDYSTVHYPQDIRNCTNCHDGANPATPDGDNWKNRPTKEACGACHDQVDFNNHPTQGFVQSDNSVCGQCHVPFSSKLRQAVTNAHTITAEELAKQFRFEILSVVYDAGVRNVTVDFAVTNPVDGNRYDIQNDPAFTAGGGASRMGVLIGWDSTDYSNNGSTNHPAQPISINPLFGGASNNGDNSFRVSANIPTAARGTGVVALEGHPALNGTRIPVANTVQYFAITGNLQARRETVSIDKCNQCHGNLSLHGNNRQGTVEVCVICHNPDATDIEVRPAAADSNGDGLFDNFGAPGVDGKREEPIHFNRMIHAIHAGQASEHGFREKGIVVYGFRSSVHDFSHTRYPGILSNCNTCHINNSYQLPVPAGSHGTTVQTGNSSLSGTAAVNSLATPGDDLNISPMAAVCSSCHDGTNARRHMEVVGQAVFDQTQTVIDSAVIEVCDACHGPGEFKDVAVVHNVR